MSVFGENYECPVMQGSDGRIPKGVYLWGTVGGGKTMLMDMFYDTLEGKYFRNYLGCISSGGLSRFLMLLTVLLKLLAGSRSGYLRIRKKIIPEPDPSSSGSEMSLK